MSQPEKKQQVEAIFEKIGTNKHEKRAFKPSIADIISKIRKDINPQAEQLNEIENVDVLVSSKERGESVVGVEALTTPEQQAAFLNEIDPRNTRGYFDAGYIKWARDNSKSKPNLASIRSKISFWLGSTFIANPASKGMPDYIWYLPQDRNICFSGQLANVRLNKKYILATDNYIREQREKITSRCTTIFLIIGMLIGLSTWGIHKVSNGYSYVSNQVHASQMAKKSKDEQLTALVAEANELAAKYKAGNLDAVELKKQLTVLSEREKTINELK